MIAQSRGYSAQERHVAKPEPMFGQWHFVNFNFTTVSSLGHIRGIRHPNEPATSLDNRMGSLKSSSDLACLIVP